MPKRPIKIEAMDLSDPGPCICTDPDLPDPQCLCPAGAAAYTAFMDTTHATCPVNHDHYREWGDDGCPACGFYSK